MASYARATEPQSINADDTRPQLSAQRWLQGELQQRESESESSMGHRASASATTTPDLTHYSAFACEATPTTRRQVDITSAHHLAGLRQAAVLLREGHGRRPQCTTKEFDALRARSRHEIALQA